MSGPVDHTGKVFTRLTVISRAANSKSGGARWHCRCSCGKDVVKEGYRLVSGYAKSCGCLSADLSKTRFSTHGESTSGGLYKAWENALSRTRSDLPNFRPYYKDRGIKVCQRWQTYMQFRDDILAEIGPKPDPALTLDRINNDGDYEPGNVRWATRAEQLANQKRREQCRDS